MRTINLAIVALALVTTMCRTSTAQIGLHDMFRVKAGIFASGSQPAIPNFDSAWIKVGVEVSMPLAIGLPGLGSKIEIDYITNRGSRIIPITLNSIYHPASLVGVPLYAGGGVGYWTSHASSGRDGSAFGFRLIAGIETGPRSFIEVQYDGVGKIGDVNGRGWSVLFGMKF